MLPHRYYDREFISSYEAGGYFIAPLEQRYTLRKGVTPSATCPHGQAVRINESVGCPVTLHIATNGAVHYPPVQGVRLPAIDIGST